MKTEKKLYTHIPNFLTSMNVLSGSIAVIIALQSPEYLILSSVLIVVGAVFDFFDGMSARLLKAYSPMGKELDSLADMVSFGVAPAMIMFQLLKSSVLGNYNPVNFQDTGWSTLLTILFSCLIVVLSAVRLAKFNIDTRQSDSFIGMPTPAYALLIASIPLVISMQSDFFLTHLLNNTYTLLGITFFGSLLLVSEIPMFSLKFKNLGFKDNKLRFFFLVLCVTLLLFFKYAGITLIILSYIIISVISSLLDNKSDTSKVA